MSKKLWIMLLFILDSLIIISGIIYSIYSFINGDTFLVLQAKIPGYIFGAAAIFIGVRYFKGILRLRKTINIEDLSFSWNNFK